jgi:hypothetical protein
VNIGTCRYVETTEYTYIFSNNVKQQVEVYKRFKANIEINKEKKKSKHMGPLDPPFFKISYHYVDLDTQGGRSLDP